MRIQKKEAGEQKIKMILANFIFVMTETFPSK